MTCGIYAIRNTVTSRRYVGSSKDIELRWKQHLRKLRGGKHANPILQNAWNKYGEQAFEWLVLEECPEAELCAREQVYLDSDKLSTMLHCTRMLQ